MREKDVHAPRIAMRRLQALQTQIVMIVAALLVLVTAILGSVQVVQQRRSLTDSLYRQAQLAATSIAETTAGLEALSAELQQAPDGDLPIPQPRLYVLMMQFTERSLAGLLNANPELRFAALIAPDDTVFMHTDPLLRGLVADEIGLSGVPTESATRRTLPGYGAVYLTRARFTVAAPFEPTAYDVVVGFSAASIDRAQQRSIQAAVTVTLIALGLAAVTVWLWAYRAITRPLDQVQADIERLIPASDIALPPLSGRPGLQQLIDVVTPRMVLANRNARLVETTQKALNKMERLYETGRAISSASGLSAIFALIAEQASSEPLIDRVTILLAGPDPALAHYLSCAYVWDRQAPKHTPPPDERVALPAPTDAPDPLRTSGPVTYAHVPAELPHTHPLWPLLTAQGVQTAVIAPLSAAGRWFGVLLCVARHTGELDPGYPSFVGGLADQLAIAIENRRLFEEAQTEARRARALAGAGQVASQIGVNFAAGLSNLLVAVSGPGNYDRWWFGLADATATTLETVVASGIEVGPRVNVAQDTYALAEAARLRELVLVNDPRHDPFAQLLQIEVAQMWGKHIAVPVRNGANLLGVLLIGRGLEAPDLDERDIQLATTLASQISVAVQNRSLFAEAERRALQLATAAQISRAATAILHLEELLPLVVQQIRDAFDYARVQIFLLDNERQAATLVAAAGKGQDGQLALGSKVPVDPSTAIGQALSGARSPIDSGASPTERGALLAPEPTELALPLIARGTVLGVLDVQSQSPARFSADDASVIATLADMLATAIDNARLFETVEQGASEMAFLFNVTTIAATSASLDDSLQQVVQTLGTLLPEMSSACIFLADEEQNLVLSASLFDAPDDSALAALTAETGLAGWVAQHQQPLLIRDLAQDPRHNAPHARARTALAVPLLTGTELVGVIVLQNEQPGAFDENDQRLLLMLSGSLAAIIQNRRLLRAVQIANERLLEIDRLKTNFLAAMSHELRTPLNSIIGFSRVILKGIDGPMNETQLHDLGIIYESGKHLLGLVNDILDQAKIEAGKMELTFGYFRLQDVITSVMASAKGLTRDKPIALVTELASDLPDAYGDEFRTRQVLLNLLSNAAKFTDEGQITVRAAPIIQDGRRYIEVAVTDTGIGIAARDMPKLFVPFQQVDNSLTRKVGGTGMGLPLAKSLVELQHGQIRVESEVGVGSTFSVTIPTEPIPQAATPEEESAEGARPAPSSLRVLSGSAGGSEAAAPEDAGPPPRTALVIEDQEGALGPYRRILAPEGYAVILVTDPGAVIYTLAARPDVILIDVQMRGGTGWAVLEELRKHTAVPIVVCTEDPDSARGMALGAAAWVAKPLSAEALMGAIRDTVSAHE